MHLRDGTIGQQALFAALVAVGLLGLGLAVADKLERMGTPNVGFMLDGVYVSPTRDDVSEAGLRGGGRALTINGTAVPDNLRGRRVCPADLATDAVNTLAFRTPRGETRELRIDVRPWTAADFLFTQGATDVIGLIYLIVGVATFILRPYEVGSWALLAISTFASGALLTMFLPLDNAHPYPTVYFLVLVGVVPAVMLHLDLAFPVPHRLLVRRPRILWLVYAMGVAQATFNLLGHYTEWGGVFSHSRTIGSAAMLATILLFVGRCAILALHTRDPLVAQRARILLAGAVFGLAPFAVAQFLRENLGALEIDSRFTVWPLGIFAWAVVRVTVRHELLNARIAVRRAVLYTGAVLVLTVLALLLIAMRPYLVAFLLFPLLYLWPRFDARLQRRLYPLRARFPELLRAHGAELSTAPTVDAVLDVLAAAPGRLCNARSSVAFLLAGVGGPTETVRGVGVPRLAGGRPLAEELIVQLMRATRREILRDHLGAEPQYANIRGECAAGFDRLAADLLLPLLHDQTVVGGLAVGPRASGDPYEAAEIDALSTAAQQAVQAAMRVEAMERLRARELEFADLKRFFPPQVIDQVMARGGAAELRTQRKIVSVMFADLRGFTAFADSVEPEELMATLAEYHAAMGRRIAEWGGTLEHFAGDGFMVFFNDPVDQPDHAARAVRMALAMRDDVERLRAEWRRKGYQIHIGIGIHAGYATCGFVGYEGRRDYSVIGNVTNLASRLSDAAAPGEILISARVRAEIGDDFALEHAGELTLKGFHQPYEAFRLIGIASIAAVS